MQNSPARSQLTSRSDTIEIARVDAWLVKLVKAVVELNCLNHLLMISNVSAQPGGPPSDGSVLGIAQSHA